MRCEGLGSNWEVEVVFPRWTWPKTCLPGAPLPTCQMSELNALLYSLCSACRSCPTPPNKALFLCKPSHPTDTPGLACAFASPAQNPELLLWLSSPLIPSQPGLPLPGTICNAGGSSGRGNLQLPGWWHSSPVPESRAAADQRQSDPGSSLVTAVALPAGCPPFLSLFSFLLPGVPFLPHDRKAASVESCVGKTGVHVWSWSCWS